MWDYDDEMSPVSCSVPTVADEGNSGAPLRSKRNGKQKVKQSRSSRAKEEDAELGAAKCAVRRSRESHRGDAEPIRRLMESSPEDNESESAPSNDDIIIGRPKQLANNKVASWLRLVSMLSLVVGGAFLFAALRGGAASEHSEKIQPKAMIPRLHIRMQPPLKPPSPQTAAMLAAQNLPLSTF